MPLISCVVPCYPMEGCGERMLRDLLTSIRAQYFRDVEIIVSNGGMEGLKEFCFLWDVTYVTGKDGAAANLNNAIDHASGDIIKPMFQDDKFMAPDTLQKIADVFNPACICSSADPRLPRLDILCPACDVVSPQWIACTSHNEGEGFETWEHVPYAHSTIANLREGENTYGSPSAMAWRRNELRFDENLKWLFDCEFYGRMAERYGVPAFVDTPIFIRQWDGQATRLVATGSQRIADLNYVVEKYRDFGGMPR